MGTDGDMASGPLKCCKCGRDAVGRVYDMVEVRGEDGHWQWEQSPEPRGYCPFHEEACGTCRWVDRDGKTWDSEPPARR